MIANMNGFSRLSRGERAWTRTRVVGIVPLCVLTTIVLLFAVTAPAVRERSTANSMAMPLVAGDDKIVENITGFSGPLAIAYDSANGDMYVINYYSNTVSVISSSTNKVVATIPVALYGEGVAYDSANGNMYVTNTVAVKIAVISSSTNAIVDNITGFPSAPIQMAYDSANGDMYATDFGLGVVSVINGSTNQVVANITGFAEPTGVAYDSTNGDIYVADMDFNSQSVSVISSLTNKVVATIKVGINPVSVAYNSANGDIYVANSLSNTVSVISSSTNSVLTTIAVGSAPEGVAYDSANGDIYVTNGNSNTVSVISSSTNAVVATIGGFSGSIGLGYDSKNGNMYVTDRNSNTVSVVSTDIPGSSSTIKVGSGPFGVAYDSANGDVYTANADSNTVSVVNSTTNKVVANITGFQPYAQPFAIAYDSANGNVYVANYNANNVSIISSSTNTIVATIKVGTTPEGIAYDSANADIYVADFGSGTVSVISSSTNKVVANITGFYGPSGIAYDSANGNMYVTNLAAGTNTVSVINSSTNTILGTPITVGAGPEGIAYDSANGDMYVTNFDSDTVSVISSSTNAVLTITGFSGPTSGIGYDSANGDVYVANYYYGTMSVIDGSTNKVLDSRIPVGGAPSGVIYDSSNGEMYVSNRASNTVSVLSSRISVSVVLNPDSGSSPVPTSNYFAVSYTSGEVAQNATATASLGTLTFHFQSDIFAAVSISSSPASSSSTEIWCLSAVRSDGTCAPASFMTLGFGAPLETYFYYDLLSQNVSYYVIDGGSPLASLSYVTAPLADGGGDSPSFGSLTMSTSTQVAWALRGSSASVPASVYGGTLERWNAHGPTSWSIAGPNTISIVSYYHQYYNTFSLSIAAGGAALSNSNNVTVAYANSGVPTTSSAIYSGVNFAGWTDASKVTYGSTSSGSSSFQRWYCVSICGFTPTSGGNVYTPKYYEQFSMAFSYSVIGGGSPTAPTLNSTQLGGSFITSLANAPKSYWLDTGASWSVLPNPLAGSGTSERWVTTQTTYGTVSGATLSSFTYDHQFYFTVQSDPSEGTTSPSSDWYDAGATVQLTEVPKSGFQFIGWTGSGMGSYSGNENATLTMNGAITETAKFAAIPAPVSAILLQIAVPVVVIGAAVVLGVSLLIRKKKKTPIGL